MNTFKVLLVGAVCLISAQEVSAHELSATLGTAAGATDYYQVHCYDDGAGATGYLELSVTDELPVAAPIVSTQVMKIDSINKTYRLLSSSDLKDGDASSSPELAASWGNGFYFVTVNKTKAGAEKYTLSYHCMTAGNEHTGTDITPLQDEQPK